MIAVLIIFTALLSVAVFAIPEIPGDLLAATFLVGGAMNILFHRSARWSYQLGRRMPPLFGFNFWEALGERGAQSLYLAIGIVSMAEGALALVLYMLRR